MAEAMGEEQPHSILRRKASAGKQVHQARVMTLAKAVRLQAARIADELFDLPLAVIGIVVEETTGEACGTYLDDDALLILLDGPERRRGAAIVAPDIVGGLIQQQTMGRVSAPLGDSRKMTATDAAMVAPMLDALFERVSPVLEIDAEKRMMAGYSFGARAEDTRVLGMALDAQNYHVVRLTFDMASGARQGDMTILLPHVPILSPLDPDALGNDSGQAAKPQTLNETVMRLPADLNMVLCHLTMPLIEVEGFSVGQKLPLPQNTFPETQIVAATGQVIGTGTLGQTDGVRALRLTRDPIHATQPRRRLSDRDDLDLPEIKALPEARRDKDTFTDGGDLDEATKLASVMDGASAEGVSTGGDNRPFDQSDLPALDTISTKPALPDIGGLPELDDFPDLADLPDLATLPDLADLTKAG